MLPHQTPKGFVASSTRFLPTGSLGVWGEKQEKKIILRGD
jgi:hypothetical protein